MQAVPADSSLRKITLRPNTTQYLGRSRACGIMHIKCSRKQVQIDTYDSQVTVTRLGRHGSYLNGQLLRAGQTVPLTDAASLQLLRGRFEYQIRVTPQKPVPRQPSIRAALQRSAASLPSASTEPPFKPGPSSSLDICMTDLSVDHNQDQDNKNFDQDLKEQKNKLKNLELEDTDLKEALGEEERLTRDGSQSPSLLSGNSAEMETSNGTSKRKVSKPGKKHSRDASASKEYKCEKSSPVEKRSRKGTPGRHDASSPNEQDLVSIEQFSDSSDQEDSNVEEIEKKLAALREEASRSQPSTSTAKPSTSTESGSASVKGQTGGSAAPVKADRSGWRDEEHFHVFNAQGLEHRPKIAAFDLDGTLITTRSGRVFAQNDDDWQILMPEIPKRMKALHREEGFKVVIFSNQRGLAKGLTNLAGFKRKIEAVVAKFGVPVQAFVSSGGGMFRKPLPGMWTELECMENGPVPVEREASFYVGDAAGRPAAGGGKKKKDFAMSDRLFAHNLGLAFHTPEEFFQGKPPLPFDRPSFNPKDHLERDAGSLLDPPHAETALADQVELVVMVGSPASGKSHFVKKHFGTYEIVSQDMLKTLQKCLSTAESHLKAGRSVIVDNTNPERATRSKYVGVAESCGGVKTRCFVMDVSQRHALHNNRFRHLVGADKAHRNVSDIVVNTFFAKLEPPVIEEGWQEVVKVNFVPDFKDHAAKDLYFMHLLEK